MKSKEGFDSETSSSSTATNTNTNTNTNNNGIAGNAQTYAANIKSAFIKNQDILLITKYRTDYENAILNLDDYISSEMLKTALNIDPANTIKTINILTKLNETKNALNNVMKLIDSNH